MQPLRTHHPVLAGQRRGCRMQISPHQFETYRSLIQSGQIDQCEVPKIMETNLAFKKWYLERSECDLLREAVHRDSATRDVAA
jgi:hypothetical protein